MKAQTYLDIRRGLDLIHSQISGVLYGDEHKKSSIATEAGALELLSEVDEVNETLREVIAHDSGVPCKALPA